MSLHMGNRTSIRLSRVPNAPADAEPLKVNDRIEARWRAQSLEPYGGVLWYKGRIEAIHDNPLSYDILYEDGEEEIGVPVSV